MGGGMPMTTTGKFRILRVKIKNRVEKERSHMFGKRAVRWPGVKPFISFTFDDFPRSAYLGGGKILRKYSLRGTYFASFGLMGNDSPSGLIFSRTDLKDVLADGHEIGSHTYGHLDPWKTSPAVFEESLIKNREALKAILPDCDFRTLAYPLTEPHPRVKRVSQKYFDSCRGGGRVINAGRIDLNLLKSFFIDKKNREDLGFFKKLIEMNAGENGWLIFSTHDISESPSDFGCRPDIFEAIVGLAAESSAAILPVAEVYDRAWGKNASTDLCTPKA